MANIKGGRVLEVGCGGGVFSKGLKKYRRDLTLYGVDISAKSIDFAKRTSRGIVFKKASVYKLPFPDDFFDSLTSFDVFEHLTDPKKALSEIRRVTKSTGLVHIVVPLEGSLFTIHGWLWKLFKLNFEEEQIGHLNRFTFRTVSQLLQIDHFEIKRHWYSRHFVIELVDVVYRMVLKSRKTLEINPSFSVESTLESTKGIVSILLEYLYKVMITISNLQSRVMHSIPGHTLHITAVKK